MLRLVVSELNKINLIFSIDCIQSFFFIKLKIIKYPVPRSYFTEYQPIDIIKSRKLSI